MPRIRVYPDALRAKAKELESVIDDQRQVIQDASHIIGDLFDWQGEAHKAFIQAFERVKPVYERFAADTYKFAGYLVNYANTMEYLDISAGEVFPGRNIPRSPDRIVGPGLPLA